MSTYTATTVPLSLSRHGIRFAYRRWASERLAPVFNQHFTGNSTMGSCGSGRLPRSVRSSSSIMRVCEFDRRVPTTFAGMARTRKRSSIVSIEKMIFWVSRSAEWSAADHTRRPELVRSSSWSDPRVILTGMAGSHHARDGAIFVYLQSAENLWLKFSSRL